MTGPKLFLLAWRNLWRQKLRTFLTVSAIAFGLFLAVIMTATQDQSFSDFIDTAARMGAGHVTLQHPDYADSPTMANAVTGADAKRAAALDTRYVATAVERISGQTMLSTSEDSFGAFFIAYDPASETYDTMRLSDGLVEGRMFETATDDGIVLGSTLARNLGAELGDKVVFTMTDCHGEIVAGMERLSGVVTTNTPSLDAGLALLPIGTVRALVGYDPTETSQIAVYLDDSRRSSQVAAALAAVVGDDAAIPTWDRVRPEIRSFIAMKVGGGRVFIGIIALLVVAGIYNTLFISVMERTREFGVMRAIGYSSGQLFRLVLWESAWLAVLGLAVGGPLTALLYYPLHKDGIDMTAMFKSGDQAVEISGVGFDMVMRIGIFPEHLATIVALVFLATLAAGLYPAWKVGRVEPVESINLV